MHSYDRYSAAAVEAHALHILCYAIGGDRAILKAGVELVDSAFAHSLNPGVRQHDLQKEKFCLEVLGDISNDIWHSSCFEQRRCCGECVLSCSPYLAPLHKHVVDGCAVVPGL